MAWRDVDELSFVWWNTSLSPPINKKGAQGSATSDELNFVTEEIRALRRELGFSVLGLAEVKSDYLHAIMHTLADPSLQLLDLTKQEGNRIHDTAIIFDRDKLRCEDYLSSTAGYGKTTLKLGERITFVTLANGLTIHMILSHWTSRMSAGEYEPVRPEYGMRLRDSLDKIRDREASPHIVLMGDYNDDPSSPSLTSHLLATRDRTLAKKKPKDYLYNPFWRLMGESLPADPHLGNASICGTHYNPTGNTTEWVTFDQIMFSPNFLNGPAALLDEERTRIVTSPGLESRVRPRGGIFDHFPVCSTVRLRLNKP